MTFSLRGRVIFFATNNLNKFNEARKVLTKKKIAVGMLRVKTLEIQSESLEEIAKISAVESFRNCHLPIIVEDAGLFIDTLNGFPGPYSAYVYKTIGNEGLLRVMERVESRSAKFKSIIAHCSDDFKFPLCFQGEVHGEIVKKEKHGVNKAGFGFDPIFKPENCNKTFAEMNLLEKNSYSHRAKALKKFAKWYKKLQ